MGNFSVNRYARLEVGTAAVGLHYIVDMAEIPTHAERVEIDTNGDGQVSDEEAQAYLAQVANMLPQTLQLTVDGVTLPWEVTTQTIAFPVGQASLPTLRMEFTLRAPLAPLPFTVEETYPYTLDFVDQTYADRLGWQEVIAVAGPGATIDRANVPSVDQSNELRSYPIDLLQDPLQVNQAELVGMFSPIASGGPSQPTVGAEAAAGQSSLGGEEGFVKLIALPELGPWAMMLALLAAFGWGAAHALSPGHGKSIVAAYLVGTRGTFRHALFLGATTTITHTLGVFALGLATLAASQFFLPERIFPWLSTLSGLLVVTIGLSIGWSRLRTLLAPAQGHDHPHDHPHDHSHDHPHDHPHDHSHDHDHSHMHGHGLGQHSHLPPEMNGSTVSWRGLLALGISGGILPCPSALVVLLGAIALGRVAFGLVLILVFSLGLATALTLFGVALLYAGKYFARIPDSGRYARYLALASAAFITLVGAGITVQALMATGLFNA
jgi:ABC-type nickel/cobalt efflux system permease component RcnA